MASEIAEIEPVDSSFASHEFTLPLITSDIKFEVLKMKGSTFIWIGDARNAKFADLSYGLPTVSSSCCPISTRIIGIASSHTTSQTMAEKLSKKLKKPVYISFNIEADQKPLLEKIEERLIEEIGINSECF